LSQKLLVSPEAVSFASITESPGQAVKAKKPSEKIGSTRIWAVGGGKGGTGKSFVAANLGLLLAEKALKINLVDADLGAPNLHTFLGIQDPAPNLGDFLHRRDLTLNQVAIATPESSLRLVPGPTRTLFGNNLKYFQKRKLLNHIRRLDGAITLVDIGAGTDFNDLDFFLVSDLGIVVATPDPASVENAYHFLRSAAYRTLEASVRKLGIEALLDRMMKARHSGPISIPELLQELSKLDKGSAQVLAGALQLRENFLIMNQTHKSSPESVGPSICDVSRKVLGIPLRFLGAIPWDETSRLSLKGFTPHVRSFPGSKASHALRQITDHLVSSQVPADNGN
jgi:flagellar biosynthesis protein FlhG